jgi:hypothetical protein
VVPLVLLQRIEKTATKQYGNGKRKKESGKRKTEMGRLMKEGKKRRVAWRGGDKSNCLGMMDAREWDWRLGFWVFLGLFWAFSGFWDFGIFGILGFWDFRTLGIVQNSGKIGVEIYWSG